jgi:hypothetical protein
MSRWKIQVTEQTSASPSDVWRTIVDFDAWPAWNPGYRVAHLDGSLEPGMPGRVTLANGMRRPFTLEEATRERSLVIGASGPGLRQSFGHTVEPLAAGGSRVSMSATMQGPLVPIFSRIFGRVMAGYYPTAVKRLVATAEGRIVEPIGHP